jgi:hypothetical protein
MLNGVNFANYQGLLNHREHQVLNEKKKQNQQRKPNVRLKKRENENFDLVKGNSFEFQNSAFQNESVSFVR